MPTESFIATLLAAASFLKKPIQGVASQSLKDAYEATKDYMRGKLAPHPGAVQALDLATEKPDSLIRRALLIEESASSGLESDAELARLCGHLAALLPFPAEAGIQSVRVMGTGHQVQVAGRDLITATKHVQRNAITPDDRHLTDQQRCQLQGVLGELAARLARPDGSPNYAAVHRMLQRRFDVASYLLIPHQQFAEALAFLKQQRAIHHGRLLRRDPWAYRNGFFRAIFAGARELKWDGGRVYLLAADVLNLKHPIASLKELGPNQLKTLAEAVRQQALSSRKRAQT